MKNSDGKDKIEKEGIKNNNNGEPHLLFLDVRGVYGSGWVGFREKKKTQPNQLRLGWVGSVFENFGT